MKRVFLCSKVPMTLMLRLTLTLCTPAFAPHQPPPVPLTPDGAASPLFSLSLDKHLIDACLIFYLSENILGAVVWNKIA